ncbi:MAG: hypothetical protein KBA55_15875 [Ruminococcus sp.]|nr:hypothetical protein [Ruminococcus sp.]
MTTKETNIFIYQKAIEYLWEHSQGLTQEIFETYLDDKRKTTMNEVFQVAVFSFRDWNPQFGMKRPPKVGQKILFEIKSIDK